MSSEFQLRVAGLHTLKGELANFRPTHVISLVNPDLPDTAFRPAIDGARHLVRRFFDVHRDEGYRVSQEREGPSEAHVAAIVDFLHAALVSPPPVRLLTHCHAGVSRSTAAAYIALALRDGPGRERESFDALMTVSRKPWPSRLMMGMADDMLGRGGALLEPLDAYRAQYPDRLAAHVRLYRRRMRAMP